MTNNRCANCGTQRIEFRNVKDFETKVRGVPFVVPEATIGTCISCGAKFFTPQEIRRWQELFDTEQQRTGRLLTSEDIQCIRHALGLPINSFALLIGTTRQSVYNWERKDRKAPQLRLADLLLRLTRESTVNGSVDVLQFLSEQSGVELTLPNQSPRCTPRRRLTRRGLGGRWREARDFDQAFGSKEAATPLPRICSY